MNSFHGISNSNAIISLSEMARELREKEPPPKRAALPEKKKFEIQAFNKKSPEKAELNLRTSDKLLALSNLIQWGMIGASFYGWDSAKLLNRVANLGIEICHHASSNLSVSENLLTFPIKTLLSERSYLRYILQTGSLYYLTKNSFSGILKAWKARKDSGSDAIKNAGVHLFNLASGVIFAANSFGFISLNRPQQKPTSPTTEDQPQQKSISSTTERCISSNPDDLCQNLDTQHLCDGNLGIPRDQMPQVVGDVREQFLTAQSKTTSVYSKEIPAHKLVPIQAELDGKKIFKMVESYHKGSFNPCDQEILVAKDAQHYRIIDGHHTATACRILDAQKNNSMKQKAVVIWDFGKQVLKNLENFPGVFRASLKG